ncbi:MAG TPA: AzlD domain-containing protein [Actinomycetes bacterium]|nr:AzlD domain-containing protein [Actinomycetes bacterium]
MTAAWMTVLVVGLATMAIKASGALLVAARPLPPRLRGALDHLAPAVLAALVVTQTVGGDRAFVLDARLAGLAAAAVAVAVRAPLLAVVAVAAAAAAIARLVS